ncbi:MAG: DinB family protein [Cyclobacteriaceae bacterium]
MKILPWFERDLSFGRPIEMLPFYLERLEGTMIRVQSKVHGIPDEILSFKPDNKWSVKEHIGHLAEVDEIALKRIDEMVAEKEVMSPAVFEPQNYNPWPIDKVVELFCTRRKSNLEKYSSLSPSSLFKSSLHPRLKLKMTPVDLAWFDAEHDDHHLVKMTEIIRTLNR